MKTLYIDFGNTRIKWSYQEKPFCIQHSEVNNLLALKEIINPQKINRIVLASTRKNKTYFDLIELIKSKNITLILAAVDHQIFQTCYQNPETLGIDRYLNMLAAKEKYQENFVIISAGSAITIDFYQHKHLGGVIAPGLQISQESLHEKIGLPFPNKKEILGTDTSSSIGAGIYFAATFMIEKYIEKIEQHQQVCFKRIYTGGDADEVCHDTRLIQSNLTFHGIDLYNQKIKI